MTKNSPEQPDFFPVRREDDQVSLSIPSEAFEHFMLSLLGKPEIIEGYVEGAFEIDFGSVQQLNNIIDNRIINTYENSSLIEFKAKLYFDNDSSMEFNSLPSFLGYQDTELRRIICTGFDFTWSYLIKFPQAESAEKQEISVFSVQRSEILNNIKKQVKVLSSFLLIKSHELPQVKYYIRYTNRQLAIDLSDKINAFLQNLLYFNFNNLEWILKSKIQSFSPLLSMITFITLFSFLSANTIGYFGGTIKELSQLEMQELSTDYRINYIIHLLFILNNRSNPKEVILLFPFIIMLSFFLLFIIMNFINNLTEYPNYKFLLFTPKSSQNKRKVLAASKKRKLLSILGIVGTLILGIFGGVLANYVYAFLTQ